MTDGDPGGATFGWRVANVMAQGSSDGRTHSKVLHVLDTSLTGNIVMRRRVGSQASDAGKSGGASND